MYGRFAGKNTGRNNEVAVRQGSIVFHHFLSFERSYTQCKVPVGDEGSCDGCNIEQVGPPGSLPWLWLVWGMQRTVGRRRFHSTRRQLGSLQGIALLRIHYQSSFEDPLQRFHISTQRREIQQGGDTRSCSTEY